MLSQIDIIDHHAMQWDPMDKAGCIGNSRDGIEHIKLLEP